MSACMHRVYLEYEVGKQTAHLLGVLRVDKEVSPPDEGVRPGVITVRKAVPKHPVGDPSEDNVHSVFHHNVHLVLGTNRARLQ